MTYVISYMTYVIKNSEGDVLVIFPLLSLSAGPETMIRHGVFMTYVTRGFNNGS